MWDLNESEEGCFSPIELEGNDEKGKRVGSVSNSSSSAVAIDDISEEEDGERGKKKRSSKIFGFSVVDHGNGDEEQPVTRQFFPVDESETGGAVANNGSPNFPRAQWVGVQFCQTETLGSTGLAKPVDVVQQQQPIKKSRRGPRSRSSQYRGVTFYRRTGRWESHIW